MAESAPPPWNGREKGLLVTQEDEREAQEEAAERTERVEPALTITGPPVASFQILLGDLEHGRPSTSALRQADPSARRRVVDANGIPLMSVRPDYSAAPQGDSRCLPESGREGRSPVTVAYDLCHRPSR